MKFEREFKDGNGQIFRAIVEIAEPGDPKLERAIMHLANKARGSKNRRAAAALGGAFRVSVLPVETPKREFTAENRAAVAAERDVRPHDGAFEWPADAQPGDLPGGGNVYERKAR